MKKVSLCIIYISISCYLLGCTSTSIDTSVPSSTQIETVSQPEVSLPDSYMIEKENYFDYQPGLECSAFASSYLLRHYDEEAEGLELYKDFPGKLSNGNGVVPQGIVTFFESKGYTAEFKYNATIEDLKHELSKGAPVIVFIHVDIPTESLHYTHYVPLVGYDETYFYFAESLDYKANYKAEKDLPYNRKTDIETFTQLWHNIDGYWDNPYFSISKQDNNNAGI